MNDEELLKYYYEELIMSLITMSLPAEKQKEMVGIVGCIGDEILEDFDNFYCLRRQVYIDRKVFDERQFQLLDDFNKYLDKYNGHNQDFYWDIEELKNNPLWEELREESKKIVKNVFGKKYRIELQRKYSNGIEHTKRKLIEISD